MIIKAFALACVRRARACAMCARTNRCTTDVAPRKMKRMARESEGYWKKRIHGAGAKGEGRKILLTGEEDRDSSRARVNLEPTHRARGKLREVSALSMLISLSVSLDSLPSIRRGILGLPSFLSLLFGSTIGRCFFLLRSTKFARAFLLCRLIELSPFRYRGCDSLVELNEFTTLSRVESDTNVHFTRASLPSLPSSLKNLKSLTVTFQANVDCFIDWLARGLLSFKVYRHKYSWYSRSSSAQQ